MNRSDKSHIDNIQFGMKVWNSIEFNLLTKHEIIIEESCKIISKLSTELETAEDIDTAWSVINEFLALKCSPGAVVSAVKMTLTKTLLDAVKDMKCRRYVVYKGLITLLQNSSMQSFYKSNSKPFAMLGGASIKYLAEIIDSSEIDPAFDRNDPTIRQVVEATKNYIKQTPFLNEFRKPFIKYSLVPLSELFISLRKEGLIDESDFFNILHEIYFADNENQTPVNQLLLHPENSDFKFLFNVPVHIFMLVIEGCFRPLRVDTTTQGLFIQFLFNDYFTVSNEKFADEKQMLFMLSLFLSLLKRYEVSLNFDIDGLKATEYIAKNIENLNITESNLYEVLLVFCATIELNPMMLEHSIIPLVVKCMLHRKDDRTTMIFERFLILVIDMYRRLSRSEKFISNLIRSMWQKLSDFKLPKKLKRKIGNVDGNISVTESSKRLRLDSVGNLGKAINGNNDDAVNWSQLFLQLFSEEFNPIDTKTSSSNIDEHMPEWKNIQFAWSNRIGEAFSKFISGLVSKPSLVVWKTLIFTLNDYINLIKVGDLSENTLFLIDWTSAMLSQYFYGCRLVEQSDKTWEMIENNRKLQHNLLRDFGSAILSQEHNIRTMNAFLSLCYYSGNFDILSWFYRPDSIPAEQIERSVADSNDFIHAYLQPTEWILIEQRISNFGKHECRSNLNRLYMQKMKSKLVFKESNETIDVAGHLLSSALGDNEELNELNDILLDKTSNQWFIEQLARSQKIQVARNVVKLDCDPNRKSDLTKMLVRSIEDQEFFDILTIAVFDMVGLKADEKVFAGNESVCKELFSGVKKFSFADETTTKKAFELLEHLPLGYVSLNVKNILFHLTLRLLMCGPKATVQSSCKYLKSKL